MTLEQILNRENAHRVEEGDFGMIACKKHVVWCKDVLNKDYFSQLSDYVERANNDVFFNKRMVLACWEIMKEEF